MRLAALLVLAAACGSEPTHVDAAVTIAIASDDPATAVVTSKAETYVWVDEAYGVRDMVGGIDVRLDLDAAIVPLTESELGVLDSEPHQGFPDHIRLLGDDEARELGHGAVFAARVDRSDLNVLVTIDPPVQEGEAVSVVRNPGTGSNTQVEVLALGARQLELAPGYAPIRVQRTVSTTDDGDELRLSGSVRITRDPPVPCFAGDPPPCP
jgi:hypothetical protein